MNCAWQAYLNLLPPWMKQDVDRIGNIGLQELRLRVNKFPELISSEGKYSLPRRTTLDDITYCINAVTNYSPWVSASICNGFITSAGGHRVGICGEVVTVNEKISTIKHITSLCVRVARDFPDVAVEAASVSGSILIIGSPGRGKTTLLRDIIRQKSKQGSVGVVDERRELFPTINGEFCFQTGYATDVLSGCKKGIGIQMLIRTMNPTWIAVDEITDSEDCNGLIQAAWCGVGLLATAHAENIGDFLRRPVYKPLISSGIFKNVIVMHADKSWSFERLNT